MSKKKLLGITIDNDSYHLDTTRVSKSGLDLIEKSPAHYWQRYLNPNKPEEKKKEWALTGGAVGSAILEPDLFNKSYTILQDDEICKEIGGAKPRTTNKYKEWFALEEVKLKGKIILEADYHAQIIAMRDAVHNHKSAKRLLQKGQAERTFYFTDPITGVQIRIRPDWICEDLGYLVDVKTCEDASPEGFGRSAFKFKYPKQGALYTDGMKANGWTPKGFVFICVEKEPPYNVACYFIPNDIEQFGRVNYQNNLWVFKECTEKNIWPGYEDNVMQLQLPAYAYTKK